jgi:glycosyltransferase involved in cell wall biosynthesis
MNRPWLSVIVPTYNGAAYLDSALASIADQADNGVEVIAVDDGSTDATTDILHRYTGRLRLRVETRGRIGSWTANSNHGLRLASAEHACFLHQDDLWLPGRLRAMRPLIHHSARPALLLHPSRFVNTRGQHIGLWRCPLRGGLHTSADMTERLLVQNFIAIPAPIFSRQAALDVGGLDESLWYTADWDLWLKLAATGPTFYNTKPLTAFRVHSESQTMQGTSRAAEMRRQLEVVLDRHLPLVQSKRPNGAEVGAAARLSVDVNHALADAVRGCAPPWWRLGRRCWALGLSGCHRFLRDSRIAERVHARVKARW